MISLIIRLGNTFEKLLQMFFLNIGTPWNLFKCFLSKNNDSLAKLVCLINLNDADWAALAKIEFASIPFKLNSSLRGIISDKNTSADDEVEHHHELEHQNELEFCQILD